LKTILDEGVPEALADLIPGHEITSVGAEGWKSVRNGKLLKLIEAAGFEAFISNDKRIEFDQNLSRRPFAILLLSTNHWPTMQPHVGNIAAALETAQPGTITRVDVGRFIPAKLRKRDPPI